MTQSPPQYLPDRPSPEVPPSEEPSAAPRPGKGLAIAAMVVGISTIVLPWFDVALAIASAVLTAVGVILAIAALATKTSAKRIAVAGLLLSLGGMVMLSTVYLHRARDLAKSAGCAMNLSNLGKAIAMYRAVNADQFPPNLDALLQDGSQSAKMLVCPTDPSGWHTITESSPGSTYFYCAPRSNDDTLESPPVLIACDNAPIHPVNFNIFRSGGLWHALRSDMSINCYTEEEFQQELQKPHNRRFAEELAKDVAMTPQERLTYSAPALPPETQKQPPPQQPGERP